eukprot:269076_1
MSRSEASGCAVTYARTLDVPNSKHGQAIFIPVINDIYEHCLDDYVHLVKKHQNLEAINKALKEMNVFGSCDVQKCAFTLRHQSRHTINTKVSKICDDATVRFYVQLLDSLHFYLIHLFECGFRAEQVRTSDTDDHKQRADTADHNTYFDKSLARVSK